MEWIRISENKLKIMLTAADTARYALCPEEADLADKGTRRAFREILADAGKASGFDTAEDRVFVQIFPSREGGCELFITKCEVKTEKLHKRRYTEKQPSCRKLVFTFEDMSKLIAACKRLKRQGFANESQAFLDDRGSYWLLLDIFGAENDVIEQYAYVKEYGKEAPAATIKLLSEHAKQICSRKATDLLGEM